MRYASLTLFALILGVLIPVRGARAADGDPVDAAIEDYAVRSRVGETVVTPTRGPNLLFDLPRSVTVIDEQTFDQYSPRHAVDVLTRRDAGIVMDMRTTATGDPVMRGFAGFNLLALVDGNSLSTLWGEGGFAADDMYGKVDADTIGRIEVVRGPNSVMYGSSALGGVINLISRSCPIDYTSEGIDGGATVKGTYSSNMRGLRGRYEVYAATPQFKILTGISQAHYGNARDGDFETLDPSGGRETNFDFRGDWLVTPGHEITLSIMHAVRKAQKRYYRPTQDNRIRRTAVALTWTADEMFGFMTPLTWRVYYQKKRDKRTFKDTGREGYAQTETWSTDLQASTALPGRHYLTYGVHAHVDDGVSPDDEQFTFYRPSPKVSDAPDSLWANYAVFVQDEWKVIEDLLTITPALRYDYFVFNSQETRSYRAGDPSREFDFFRDKIGALTGGLGATVEFLEDWRLLVSFSRGFRQYAPNFGVRQLGNGVLVPNELLDPVTSNNYEIGLRTRYPFLHAEGFVYYSDIDKWQELRPDTFNGSDWFDFNGNGVQDANESVVSQKGVGDAYVWGIEAKATLFLAQLLEGAPEGLTLWGGFAWNRGKTDDGEYFRHTQPARGLLGVRWDDADPNRAAFAELVTEMVDRYHRIPTDRLQNDLAYRRDAQNGKSPLLRSYGGVPGYTVFALYTGVNLCESAKLSFAVENIFDKKFRRAHSRMDAFGRNFVVGLEVSF